MTAVRVLAIALPLNFAWELLQAPIYASMGDTWLEGLLVCARATLGDGVISLGLFGVGRLLFGRRWFDPPRIKRYAVILAVAIMVQIGIEWMAVAAGRWAYAPWHPRILGAGLLPILQSFVLGPLPFWVVSRWESSMQTVRH